MFPIQKKISFNNVWKIKIEENRVKQLTSLFWQYANFHSEALFNRALEIFLRGRVRGRVVVANRAEKALRVSDVCT